MLMRLSKLYCQSTKMYIATFRNKFEPITPLLVVQAFRKNGGYTYAVTTVALSVLCSLVPRPPFTAPRLQKKAARGGLGTRLLTVYSFTKVRYMYVDVGSTKQFLACLYLTSKFPP